MPEVQHNAAARHNVNNRGWSPSVDGRNPWQAVIPPNLPEPRRGDTPCLVHPTTSLIGPIGEIK
ncbi:MAG: hypothetical protein MUC78_01155 [Bacteroidales bacterium]|nr:hypothetical protein [Bacteroidales bacterium]